MTKDESWLSRIKRYNEEDLARRADELANNRRRLLNMQFEHFSQLLRLGDAAQRERAIEGLLSIKGRRVVNLLAEWLHKETDDRLREKVLDVIEECIELDLICDSFTKMRADELPVSALAIYATDIANNYTHALAA
ncbi:hypothetical protein HGA34_00510 [Candidatus Falkowbacteria bacterium]|nr:hypothetical protein [Candidatus Falkowbacteria bacterium]